MSTPRIPNVLLAMLLLLLAVEARAQAGTLRGTVVDALSGEPLPGVFVMATSSLLSDGLTVVTDAEGQYHMPGMPPGVYTLQFSGDHRFNPFMRTDLRLRPNASLRINASLFPALSDSSDYGPFHSTLLEFTDSTTGLQVEWGQGWTLPANRPGDGASAVRTAEGLAPWVPGVTEGLEGFSVQGASPHENDYLLDGLSTRDAATGLNALPVSQELLSYAGFLTGGYLPERGRTPGGLLEVQTQEGSGARTGSVFAHWAPGLLEGRRESVRDGRAPRHLGDFGATLGGSLLDRRLRYFFGITPALGRVEDTGPSGTSFSDSRGLQALGRLTYQLPPNHQVSLSVLTSPQSLREQGATLQRHTTQVALHQSSAFHDRHLLLDVHAGWLGLRDSPGDGVLQERALDQYQARARLTWVRYGSRSANTLKAGVDVEHFVHARTRAPDTRESRTPGTVLGGYVQDQWTTLANQVTLHGGLRYDVQRLETGEAGGSRVTLPLLSPRVGVVYDPNAYERLKLFAHYARYPGLVPLGLLDRATVDESLPVQGPSLIDPRLKAMASHEVVAGAALSLNRFLNLYGSHLSATYTHRALDSGLASLRTDSPGSVVLVNPGSGLGAGLPRAERTYDAVTLEFVRPFNATWMGQASYTRSWLRGNHAGPWDGVARASGPLPGDRPHVLRVQGGREAGLHPKLSLGGSLAYLGASGTPVAGGTRTPWLHTVDARLVLSWRPAKEAAVAFSLDAFNVFNFQAATRLEARDSGLEPVRHQPPRQLRLGIRYTTF